MKFRVATWIAPVLAVAILMAPPASAEQRAAPALRRPVTASFRDAPLIDVLRAIAEQAGFRLSYNSGALPAQRPLTLVLRGVPADDALRRALAGTGFTWREAGGQIALVPAPAERAARQEAGRIDGRVVSAASGEPVPGAAVSVAGTALSVQTGPDGRFTLPRVPAGRRDVRVERLGYAAKSVTGVQVNAGRSTELEVALDARSLMLEGVTVTAEQERGSTGALLRERRQAATVTDVVGRRQIEASPDADAGAVLRRVPAAEVREGKYVYIRGLGDRYGNVTLNGASLPSLTPDRKSVPLDMIPSNLLESVVTSKGYTPDLPGDYAGGLVQLRTRDVPPQRILRLTTAMGYNSAGSLRQGWLFDGCDADWTAFATCTDLPESLPGDTVAFGTGGQTAEERARIARAYSGVLPWTPTRREIPLNRGVELTYGDELRILGTPVGVISSLDWSDSYAARDGYVSRTVQGNITPGVLQYITDYSASGYGGRDVSLGGLAKVSVPFGSAHRVSLSGIMNRLQEDRVEILEGYASLTSDGHFATPQLARVQSTLWNLQLDGEHRLGRPVLEWRATRSRSERYEPGSRASLLRGAGGGTEAGGYDGIGGTLESEYDWLNEPPGGRVLHGDMDETAWSGGVDLTVPFRLRGADARIKLGGALDLRERDALQRTLLFRVDDAARGTPLDSLFSDGNIGTVVSTREFTRSDDSSVGESSVRAVYGMLDMEPLPRLRVVLGARVEAARQEVNAVNQFGDPAADLEGTRGFNESTDVLPALNLTWRLTPRMNLRGGFSRTLARPQFREIATFFYQDYFGGIAVQGNPGLRRTLIDNADLRWEAFPAGDAVLSTGVFFKRFHGPIEPLVVALGFKSLSQTWINTREADTWGFEAEFRSALGFVAAPLRAVTLSANYALLHTEVDSVAIRFPLDGTFIRRLTPETRSIFGQTPYLLNVGLGYAHPRAGTRVTALFNRSGKRLELASAEAEYPSVYELPRSELDLVLEQGLGRGLSFKLTGSRLLGNRVRFVQEFDDGQRVVSRGWDAGRTVNLSLSWDP
ncbi:TonB-dependent receptor [Longimicrobium terrae]|uniref:Outer membrane receptor protein involved in Fe transport n=1 Tax=Longimicrobium terrae TaxID=1639882 RepID=A0A841H376_9BACT|nr:TonB-dependent receptor [Longimicrobium terrae]MBB4638071.1 outer membrane receptor protein involved in Fe transport [Longimicrobium terrae]MBB6072443.1 outer membrane receptor protein involved in Fe transport [Longimicrobium terrae]NNC32143.1 TonB-dependent receptor [Longimicrobium terrae]